MTVVQLYFFNAFLNLANNNFSDFWAFKVVGFGNVIFFIYYLSILSLLSYKLNKYRCLTQKLILIK